MFVATVINFLSFSLNAGSHAAGLVVFIRKITILYIGYSPSKEQKILRPGWINVVIIWAAYIPVSIKPSPHMPHGESYSVEVFVSDLIVIWRAWTLFRDRQWLILIPFILWIGTIGELTFSAKLFPFTESIRSQG